MVKEVMDRFASFATQLCITAGIVLVIGRVEWFPEFYDVRYMGLSFLAGAAVLILLERFLSHDQGIFFQRAVAFVLVADGVGNLGLYQLYKMGFEYDKIVHFISPLILVIALVRLLHAWKGYSQKKSLVVATILVTIAGIGWELFEMWADASFGTRLFGMYGQEVSKDTRVDLILDVLGAIAGVGFVLARKRKFKVESPVVIANVAPRE